MFYDTKSTKNNEKISQKNVDEIFEDFEARSNLVGLFDLLLKIDRRNNPELYD